MKTYLHTDGRIIREDKLKNFTLPKVGDRFRFARDYCAWNKGEVVEINSWENKSGIQYTVSADGKLWPLLFSLDRLADGMFEPIPSLPVCPENRLPLPDGAVYLGKGRKFNAQHRCQYRWEDKRWERNEFNNEGDWEGTEPKSHYATTAGDACHRAQLWFDESQVPKAKDEPAKLTLEVGKRYVMRDGGVTSALVTNPGENYLFEEVPKSNMVWTRFGNYWEDGSECEYDIIREATPEECGDVAPPDYAARAKEQLQSLFISRADYSAGFRNPMIDAFIDNLIQAAKQP